MKDFIILEKNLFMKKNQRYYLNQTTTRFIEI